MGKIVAIANQKGGVGKTTTAVNLAAALGAAGKSILLIDFDPQGNATSGYGVKKKNVSGSVYELLMGRMGFDDVVVKTLYNKVSLIPSSIDLAGAELELVSMPRREFRLRDAIVAKKHTFDYILIDCPPSLGLLTLNGLNACDTILIPIQCEYYALEGLSQLMSTVRQVKKLYNPNIDIEGVLLTMYDARINLTVQVVDEVKRFFPQKVYSTAIPRNVRVSEAPSYGKPIQFYDAGSKGSQAYDALAAEFLSRNRRAGGAD
ncbi:MAG: ParA family protein [Oscillospiraceae bacterium]|nr:ParA family protein [Oscillospiraceae bacterium]